MVSPNDNIVVLTLKVSFVPRINPTILKCCKEDLFFHYSAVKQTNDVVLWIEGSDWKTPPCVFSEGLDKEHIFFFTLENLLENLLEKAESRMRYKVTDV